MSIPPPDATEPIGPSPSPDTQLADRAPLRPDPDLIDALTRSGARIGDYRVLEVIGRGGMGVVLLAEQLHPVQRQVALKLLASRRMDGRAQAWFEVERQMLARMQHPTIAQIFDAGTTREGVPYFSMERVEGEPLTRFADQHRLRVNERLALLRKICLGVHHAHSRGIIHRDLKPANILVASVDGVPTPKIIDFGIAALTTRQLQGSAPAAGTLPYMSPEQIARSEGDVDPRADVFALGVVLFELLTGERPYGDSSTRPSSATSPDVLLRGTPADAATLRRRARERRIDPRRLLALLRGDLAAIMFKAVAVDRRQRYESAAALADDLQKLLEHQPVSAVPSTRGYRLRRFIRRHRLAVALSVFAVAALLTGLALSLSSAQEAVLARERAVQEAQTAAAVAEFFSEQIQADDPGMQCNYAQYEASGDAARRAAQSLAARYPGQPRVEMRVRGLLSLTLLGAGMNDDALAQAKQARAQARTVFGRNAQETLQVELALIRIYNVVERYSDARALSRSVANRAADLLGKRHPITLAAQEELAETLVMLSDYPQAQRIAQTLLPQARQLARRDGGILLDRVVGTLADTYRLQGMDAQASVLLEERAQRMRISPGPRSQRTLDALEDLAMLEIGMDNDDHALQLLKDEVMPVYAEFCGEDAQPASTQRYLAMIYMHRQDYALAEQTLKELIWSPEDFPEAQQTMSNGFDRRDYGIALIGIGKVEDGIQSLLMADRIFARDLPATDPDRQAAIVALSEAYQSLGQAEDAARWSRQVVATEEAEEVEADPAAADPTDTSKAVPH